MASETKSQTQPPQYDTIFDRNNAAKTKYDPIRIRTTDQLLQSSLAQSLLVEGIDNDNSDLEPVINGGKCFTELIAERVRKAVAISNKDNDQSKQTVLLSQILHTGLAALFHFLQSNVTGPPLELGSATVVLGDKIANDKSLLNTVRTKMLRDLSVDGEAVYPLTPNIELFCVAKAILVDSGVLLAAKDSPPLVATTARMRVNFLHQKMLSDATGTLQKSIYDDLEVISTRVLGGGDSDSSGAEKAAFLLERAAIHTHHGFDTKARSDLEQAAVENGFEFALTGKLGKRTKFQDRDISQLVVLAKSADTVTDSKSAVASTGVNKEEKLGKSTPKEIDLNDDTLLETIAFAKEGNKPEKATTVQDESSLPATLASIDPSNQSKLNPLDSAVLLAIATAITNNSPEHGLTREETLPYATRVIEGGSSNWQIYTQALLVRSRCEAYKSRTVERGVLQMQALVDQVIADTATSDSAVVRSDTVTNQQQGNPTTFLPRPQASESAPAEERLEYIWTLNFQTRWNLEAELAQRWVSLGGLRTALDIYERLEMWAEVALCYAATEREEKAKAIVRRQLYHPTNKNAPEDEENERYEGPELSSLPADAPRLFCILGDVNEDPAMYERAWEVSGQRYARAQRSLARLYLKAQPPALEKAEEAYKKSLKINPLNHGAWFALGCVQLNREQWDDAVEAFTRTVQLEQDDAEAWSNLAAALLNVSSDGKRAAKKAAEVVPSEPASADIQAEDEEDTETAETKEQDPYKHTRDALTALHHAARLKQTDHRIWDNILTVATSLPDPLTPYKDIVFAQRKVIELLSPKKGEKAIDLSILTMLVDHLIKNFEYENLLIPANDGTDQKILRSGTVPGQILGLIDNTIIPLITHSAPLWLLVSKVELFRNQPSKALAAHEKAWRATVSSSTQPAFQMGDEKKWMEIVKATERLVRDGYARIGGMTKEGQAEDGEELVAADWRFKSRSAVRGILGKGKEFFEETDGWMRLKELQGEVTG